MKLTIFGKRWELKRVPNLGEGILGKCDPPDRKDKAISVCSGLRGEPELDVLIHEMMHAADWSKDEFWIDEVSTDIAHNLWRLGYRKTEG